MTWATTTLLLERLRDADHDAWSEFCDRFRPAVVRFVQTLGLGADDAEDAAQEALVTFHRRYRDGHFDRRKGRLSSWLFGIAYRVGLRARARRGQLDVIPAGSSSIWSRIPDRSRSRVEFDRCFEWGVLRECLRRLESEVQPQTMLAFRRLVLDQKSVTEVADELGVTKNTVMVAKFRVLKRIRELRPYLEDVATPGAPDG